MTGLESFILTRSIFFNTLFSSTYVFANKISGAWRNGFISVLFAESIILDMMLWEQLCFCENKQASFSVTAKRRRYRVGRPDRPYVTHLRLCADPNLSRCGCAKYNFGLISYLSVKTEADGLSTPRTKQLLIKAGASNRFFEDIKYSGV